MCQAVDHVSPAHAGIDRTSCYVDINGEVKLGNIGDRSLADVWDGKELHALRQQHLLVGAHGHAPLQDQPMCRA